MTFAQHDSDIPLYPKSLLEFDRTSMWHTAIASWPDACEKLESAFGSAPEF
jgi:hypothetical protein